MIAIIIAGIATVLSFVNLGFLIFVDKKIAEKGGESIFWEENK